MLWQILSKVKSMNNKLYKRLLTILIGLLIVSCCYAENTSISNNHNLVLRKYNYKNPALAGVLSWYAPGLGQFYTEKYVKGMIFFTAENALLITTISIVADFDFSFDEGMFFNFSIKPKEHITEDDNYLLILFAACYGALHMYNVIDAVVSTGNYNKHIRQQVSVSENGNIQFGIKADLPIQLSSEEKLNRKLYYYQKLKDPFVAGALSFSFTGLGQFYAEDYYSGSLFILLNLTSKFLGVVMLTDLNKRYSKRGLSDSVSWIELKQTDQIMLISYIASSVILKGINVITAVIAVNRYNKSLENQFQVPITRTSYKIDCRIDKSSQAVKMGVCFDV